MLLFFYIFFSFFCFVLFALSLSTSTIPIYMIELNLNGLLSLFTSNLPEQLVKKLYINTFRERHTQQKKRKEGENI